VFYRSQWEPSTSTPENALTGSPLDLTKLANGFHGVTSAVGAALGEAGAICFESQHHANGIVKLTVDGMFQTEYQVSWSPVTDQMARCWNDPEYATEQGAYGVAFLVMMNLSGFTVIERSRKGTGFDYRLGLESNPDGLPFQDTARLEVSGIRAGSASTIKTRVNQKLDQISRSDNTNLPSYVVVVEFSAPLSRVVKK